MVPCTSFEPHPIIIRVEENSMTREKLNKEIERLIEAQQRIQETNPPSSSSSQWLAASKELHRLIALLIGKAPKDAMGGK